MDRKERKHSNSEDAALFRDSVGELRPVNSRKRHQPQPPHKAVARRTRPAESEHLESLHDNQPAEPEAGNLDEQTFTRGNVTRRMLRDLRRGKYTIREHIDLHGCTREEAQLLLREFVEQSTGTGIRCIRVVHGKGLRSGPDGPVLKNAVSNWLRCWPEVRAFCPARNCDGGSGATYVLLQNR